MEVAKPMNASDKLDFVLQQLEGASLAQAEAEMAGDAQLVDALDRLRRKVDLLLEDELEIQVPEHLADLTWNRVLEQGRRNRPEYVPKTVPFRWADLAVAASVFLAGLLTFVPALQRSKDQVAQAGCAFNLHRLGVALSQYAGQHHQYPYAPHDQPDAVAGTFAVTLQDSGMLPDLNSLECPCDGNAEKGPLPHLATLKSMRKKSPRDYYQSLDFNYAYHVGYRQASGEPGPLSERLEATIPLLADQPGFRDGQILSGNSPNHGGRGQNVLFTDGHTSWHTTRQVNPRDSDIFLNEEQIPGPGISIEDAALVPSLFPFQVSP